MTGAGGGARPWASFVTLCLGFFLASLDGTIVAVATPALVDDLGITVAQAIWVTSAYLTAYASPMLLTGRLGDRFGRRRLYAIGIAVFAAGSLLSGVADALLPLVAGRIVAGIGAALFTPQALAILTATMPKARLGLALGIWSTVAAVATVVGPIVGGVLVAGPGWRWVFLVNLPIAAVLLVAAALTLPRSERIVATIPVRAAVASVVGIAAVVTALQGVAEGWSWWVPVGLAALAIVAAALMRARPDESALIPPALPRSPGFLVGLAGIGSAAITVTALPLMLMVWAQAAAGLDPLAAGLLVVPIGVLAAAIGPAAGALIDRFGAARIAGAALALAIVGLLATGVALLAPEHPMLVLPGMAVFGLSNGAIWASLSMIALGGLDPAMRGAGSAVYNTARQLAAAAGAAAAGVVVTATLVVAFAADPAALEAALEARVAPGGLAAFSAAFAVAVGVLAVVPAAALALLLASAGRRSPADPARLES